MNTDSGLNQQFHMTCWIPDIVSIQMGWTKKRKRTVATRQIWFSGPEFRCCNRIFDFISVLRSLELLWNICCTFWEAALSSMFRSKCYYQHECTDRGTKSCFPSTSDFDLVFTSRIAVVFANRKTFPGLSVYRFNYLRLNDLSWPFMEYVFLALWGAVGNI